MKKLIRNLLLLNKCDMRTISMVIIRHATDKLRITCVGIPPHSMRKLAEILKVEELVCAAMDKKNGARAIRYDKAVLIIKIQKTDPCVSIVVGDRDFPVTSPDMLPAILAMYPEAMNIYTAH